MASEENSLFRDCDCHDRNLVDLQRSSYPPHVLEAAERLYMSFDCTSLSLWSHVARMSVRSSAPLGSRRPPQLRSIVPTKALRHGSLKTLSQTLCRRRRVPNLLRILCSTKPDRTDVHTILCSFYTGFECPHIKYLLWRGGLRRPLRQWWISGANLSPSPTVYVGPYLIR